MLEGEKVIAANLSEKNARAIACGPIAMMALRLSGEGKAAEATRLTRELVRLFDSTPPCALCGEVRDEEELAPYELGGVAHRQCIVTEEHAWNNRRLHE